MIIEITNIGNWDTELSYEEQDEAVVKWLSESFSVVNKLCFNEQCEVTGEEWCGTYGTPDSFTGREICGKLRCMNGKPTIYDLKRHSSCTWNCTEFNVKVTMTSTWNNPPNSAGCLSSSGVTFNVEELV